MANSCRLWLSLRFHQLPLEIFTRGGNTSQIELVAAGQRVCQCNRLAGDYGIRPGMSLGAASALVSGLCIYQRDEKAEQRHLENIAAWAGQFTSFLSMSSPDTVLLEVGGSLMLFDGMDGLLEKLRNALAKLGYRHFHMAVAPTPLAAELFTRVGQQTEVMSRPAIRGHLARLPLSVLNLSSRELLDLQSMGLQSIGDCLRLPRDGLTRRVGSPALLLLDQAMGDVPDPRPRFKPAPRFESHLQLPAETASSEALLFAGRRQLLELTGFLQSCCGSVQRLEWSLEHAGEPPTRVTLGLVAPSRDYQHLHDLLRERLEGIRLREPVRALQLVAGRIEASGDIQQVMFREQDSSGDQANLVERLQARLGDDVTHGICLLADHRPEYAWRLCAPGESGAAINPANRRPLWLMDQPRKLEVRKGWPYLDGRLLLQHSRERIESGWWSGEDVSRDYFIATTPAARRLWVFRDTSGWYLQGLFD